MIRAEYLIRTRDRHGIRILPQLVVLGAETSLGDPKLGGPIVTEAYNLGCIKWRPRTAENAVYHDLSTGTFERRGVLWFRFPTADAGMEAWGRFIVTEGYRDALLNQRWVWERPLETAVFWGITLTVLVVGAVVFRRLRPHFADVLA